MGRFREFFEAKENGKGNGNGFPEMPAFLMRPKGKPYVIKWRPKHIPQASERFVAGDGYWIDPQNKLIRVPEIHAEWIRENIPHCRKLGLDACNSWAISRGWVRLRDTGMNWVYLDAKADAIKRSRRVWQPILDQAIHRAGHWNFRFEVRQGERRMDFNLPRDQARLNWWLHSL